MNRAYYIVKDEDPEEFLINYEKILNNNGWETTIDTKPVSINVEKDTHKAIILATTPQNNEDGEIEFLFILNNKEDLSLIRLYRIKLRSNHKKK